MTTIEFGDNEQQLYLNVSFIPDLCRNIKFLDIFLS